MASTNSPTEGNRRHDNKTSREDYTTSTYRRRRHNYPTASINDSPEHERNKDDLSVSETSAGSYWEPLHDTHQVEDSDERSEYFFPSGHSSADDPQQSSGRQIHHQVDEEGREYGARGIADNESLFDTNVHAEEMVSMMDDQPCSNCNDVIFTIIPDKVDKDDSITGSLLRQCTQCQHVDVVDGTMDIYGAREKQPPTYNTEMAIVDEKTIRDGGTPEAHAMEALQDEETVGEEAVLRNLEEIVDSVMRLPCIVCDGRNFTFIPDTTNKTKKDSSILARECTHCKHVDGYDDTMNIFDIVAQLSRKEYKAAECVICKNDDPEKFVFDEKDGEICLTCMECKNSTPVGREAIVQGSGEKGGGSDSGDIMVNDVPFTNVVCEWCGNPDNFHVEQDLDGNIEYIKCRGRRCSNRWIPNFGVKGEDPSSEDPRYPSPRTRIRNLFKLQHGDHFAFHQPAGYWHHGIVVKVHDAGNLKMKVIHYSPDGNVTLKDIVLCRGKVQEDWIDVDPSKQEMYRFDYNLKKCFSPREVVQRARQRLGESNYNLLTNNCEHFARWCKTGKTASSQVQLFKQYCTSVAKNITGSFIGKAGLSLVPQKFSLAFMMSEMDSVLQEIRNASEQKSLGNISQTEFVKIAVKRGVRGAVASVGTVAAEFAGSRAAEAIAYRLSAQAGTMIIPIPFVGSIIGATLGYVIFTGLGQVVGRTVASKVEEQSEK